MFKTNKELLNKESFQKALISMPAISLSAEEADTFIDYIFDQSVLKNNARQIKMAKATKNIRAMGLGAEKILHPGDTFSSSDYKKTLTHNLITLTAKKARACAVIHDDDLEDNIEGDEFTDHIMKMITKQIANELDEAYWIGDTHNLSGFGVAGTSTDARSLWDGWRYRINHSASGEDYENDVSGSAVILNAAVTASGSATSTSADHLVDSAATFTAALVGLSVHNITDNTYAIVSAYNSATDLTLSADIMASGEKYEISDYVLPGKIAEQKTAAPYNWEFKFAKALKKLPSIYKQDGLANLRFFTNDQVVQDYIDALAARSTILGDSAILGKAAIQYGEVPIVSCPLMPITLDADGVLAGGSYTDCMLTHKDNLVVGVHRDIKVETERQAADESTYFYVSLRTDVAVENVAACVLVKNLTIA
jgi:hypothetical protein